MRKEAAVADPYRASRILYVIEACAENFITVLMTGAFLATLTSAIGLSDATTAVISSVSSLSGFFQIITIFIAHKTPVKRWVIPIQLLAHLLFSGLYLIPVLNIRSGAGIIFFVLMISAQAIKAVVSPVKINWFYAMVDPEKRGSFTSLLTAVSVVGQIFFSLGASITLDYFTNSGKQTEAFLITAIVILILIIFDLLPLILSKEKPTDVKKAPSPFGSLREIFSVQPYRIFLIICVISSIGTGIAVPFLATYQINELGFSLSFIAAIDVIVNIVWVVSLTAFGAASRKLPYSLIMRASAIISLVAYTVLAFTTPDNGVILFTAYRIILIISSSASGVASRSLLFDLVRPELRTNALAIYMMLTGALSFFTTLVMTPIFNYLQANRPVIFGVELYAQQILTVATVGVMIIVNVLWGIFYKKLEVLH